MLHLLLGRSGSGKTWETVRRVGEKTQTDKPVYVIVPDQYTVAAERIYVDRLGEEQMHRVRVMSLKRLSSLLCRGERVSMNGGGKAILVRRAFDAVSDHFRYYPADYRNVDFLLRLKHVIHELKVNGVSPEQLQRAAELSDQPKLYDIALIYGAFEAFLHEGLFDPDDDLTQFAGQIAAETLFADAVIFVDFFRSFKAQELAVLQACLRNGAQVTVALPTDTAVGGDGTELLAEVTRTARRLMGFCKKYDIPVTVETLTEQHRFGNGELAFLERNFFGDGVWDKAPEHVHLYRADDLFDEVDAIAAKITELVRDHGYRYRDFSVITRDIDAYAGFLEPVFSQYNIPLFYHKKTPLKQKMLLTAVSAFLDMAADGYLPDRVLTFLKAGFTPFSEGEIARFEAYVVNWNISYDRFKSEFMRSVKGFQTEDSLQDKRILEEVNRVRQYVVDLVEQFRRDTAGKTVRDISAALFYVLESLQVQHKLESTAEDYARHGEQALCREQMQVYSLLMGALDEFVLVAGDSVMPVGEYRDFLDILIEELDIAIIPTSIDEVLAGSVDAMPMMGSRCVFVAGLQEGTFPKTVTEDSLISDSDRILLEEYDIAFGNTGERKVLFERYLGYTALTAASAELYLSYGAGGGGVPSLLVREVQRIFPALAETFAPSVNDPEGLARRLQARAPAFSSYVRTGAEELKTYFSQVAPYGDYIRYREMPHKLQAETGRRMFGPALQISATKLDTFYSCKYSYFCRFGMRVEEERPFTLDSATIGTLTHDVLEHIMRDGIDRPVGVISAEVRSLIARRQVEFLHGEAPTENFLHHWEIVAKRVLRTVLYFREEMAQSKFVPCGFEINIGTDVAPVEIPIDGGSVLLHGKVDRADVYRDRDGRCYLRIVDYKTGSKHFDLQQFANGLQMQMLIYLYALIHNGYPGNEQYIPAGVVYANANPVVVKVEYGASSQAAEEKWEQSRKRSGLFLCNADVLRAMDRELQGKYIDVMAATKTSSLASEEEFDKLFAMARDLMARMGTALMAGDIEKDSLEIGTTVDGCKYCAMGKYCEKVYREAVKPSLIIPKALEED